MAHDNTHYPHRIGFRLDDKSWLKLEIVIAGTGLSPHDWCRIATLQRLNEEYGLTRSERFLFEQIARTQYLVGLGFQMLADKKLSTEEWKKLRAFAREKIGVITDRTLAELETRTDVQGPGAGVIKLR